MEFSKLTFNNPALGTLSGWSGTQFFSSLVPALLSMFLVVGVVIFLFNLILGGIEWTSAGGDKGKLESAKQKLSNAIIGITILLSFFAILSLVECFFGIGLRNINIGLFQINFSGVPFCK